MSLLDVASPTESSPPPPAYESIEDEFDRKTTTAAEHSLRVAEQEQQQQRQQQDSSSLERWEHDTHRETNAVRLAESSAQIPSSSSGQASLSTPSTSSKAREALSRSPYDIDSTYSSTYQSVTPLYIQKKLPKSANPSTNQQKERPSWLPPPQSPERGDGASLERARSDSSRRSLPNIPTQQSQSMHHILPEEPEEDRSLPPPPFAPVDNSLDGPAYERYPSNMPRQIPGHTVILRYAGEDLSASPPPSPPQSPIPSVTQGLNLRRRAGSPRMSMNSNTYQNRQIPNGLQAHHRMGPPLPVPMTSGLPASSPRQQHVPPPPRMDFDPSVAYDDTKSIFGQLPMDTIKKGEGAASLYNSAVASHFSPQTVRQVAQPKTKRYAESIISVRSESTASEYQPSLNNSIQQFYNAQGASAFYAQGVVPSNIQQTNAPRYPPTQQSVQYSSQRNFSERPMSSLSQGDQPRWSMYPQQQYYQR